MKEILIASCAALALLAATSGVGGQTHPKAITPIQPVLSDEGPDISEYVSADLEEGEKAFMRQHMNALPAKVRGEIHAQRPETVSFIVVEGATGKIHYNRPEEVGSFEVRPGFDLSGDEHPIDRADRAETADPGPYAGSGPYRRIYTTPVPASPVPKPDEQTWYTEGGIVSTACKAGTFAKGDLGYAYMGGWSAKWASDPVASTIDAGLQYNLGASEASYDDYSMFMKIGGLSKGQTIISKGNGEDFNGKSLHPQPTHIVCGGSTNLAFAVYPTWQLRTVMPSCWQGSGNDALFIGWANGKCSTYALLLRGGSQHFKDFLGADHAAYIEWVAPSFDEGGWAHEIKWKVPNLKTGKFTTVTTTSAPCGGCIFKWMTSIAQSKENLADKSTFSATWSHRSISGYAVGVGYEGGHDLVPLTEELTNCSEYPLWHPPYGADHKADCKNMPTKGLTGVEQSVKVTGYSAEGEKDLIDLKY